ncbi:unnamed protein product [Rhizophagus irregularis]|nr:unnamed protein product [Rhizophagus irregularis]CAB5205969.1 unnamed protein product [Rhizophagus irregularis]
MLGFPSGNFIIFSQKSGRVALTRRICENENGRRVDQKFITVHLPATVCSTITRMCFLGGLMIRSRKEKHKNNDINHSTT